MLAVDNSLFLRANYRLPCSWPFTRISLRQNKRDARFAIKRTWGMVSHASYDLGLPNCQPLGSGAPTACRHSVSGTVSLPSSGCFSPFHHCTGSLSVDKEYLGLDRGRPVFRQDFSCPALLKDPIILLCIRDCHPLWSAFPDRSA